MTKDQVSVDEAIEYLNSLIESDPVAIRALLMNRVPCSGDLAEHPTCQVRAIDRGLYVGMMGVLNGLFGIYPDGYGKINYIIKDSENHLGGILVGFSKVPPEEHNS